MNADPRSVPRRPASSLVAWSMVLILAGMVSTLGAQEERSEPEPTPSPTVTPIPASEIPARVGETAALVREFEADAEPVERTDQIAGEIPEITETIDALEQEVLPLLEGDGPVHALEDTRADLTRLERQLSGWLATLKVETDALDRDLAGLKGHLELWELTMESADSEELPDALVDQLRDTIGAIFDVRTIVTDRRSELLTLQAKVAEQRSRLRLLGEQISRTVEVRKQHLLRFDSPPLWRAFGENRQDDLGAQVGEAVRRNLQVLEQFIRDNTEGLFREVVILIVVYLVFFRLGRQATFWAQSDESLHATARVLQHPLAAAVLVTMIVLGSLFHPTAPAAVINLSGAILLLAVLRLVPHLVRREMRPAIGMLVSLIVLYLVVDLVPNTFLLDRIGMLVLAVAGAASCGWTLRKEFSLDDVRRDGWFWGGTWVAALATVFFAVAAIANTIGAVALASLLSIATLGAIYDAITLWIFALVLFGAVAIALKTTNARRLLIVRYHSDRIQAVLVKAIKVLAVVAWGVYALERFGLLSWARETAERVFFSEYRIGDFSLSVSGVVIFVVVIWFSIKLSQFISFVLDEDVLPRLDLPKGVPATISKTTTYVVVALGVIIAISAAGIDLSKATILVGALGVGIGFGLQNAVNNFVSGLILLFGRPINVGDKIQIDTVSGVVTDIGIRATVVKTWQGAEVIVPNASLISDNLINWTLSDDRRRMEIPVGVAYGSPTAQVIELLVEVARAHDEVLDDPEPQAIFTGFGDSALDFELRAWTRGNFVVISSDLRVGVDQTLAENGIEIPFPQRDLHLRTVGKRAAASLAGGNAKTSTNVEDDEESVPPESIGAIDSGEEKG